MSLADFLADGSVMAEIVLMNRDYLICGEFAKFNLHIHSREIPLMSFRDRINILSDDAMSIEILDIDHQDEQEGNLTRAFSRMMQSTESLLSIDSNISKFSNSSMDLSNIISPLKSLSSSSLLSIDSNEKIQLQDEYNLLIPFEIFIETDLQFFNAQCHIKVTLLEGKGKRGSKEIMFNRNLVKILNDGSDENQQMTREERGKGGKENHHYTSFKKIKNISKTFKLIRPFNASLEVSSVREYEAILTISLENIGMETLKIIKMDYLITDLKYNRIGTSKMDILSDYFMRLIPLSSSTSNFPLEKEGKEKQKEEELPFELKGKCLLKSSLKLITEPSFIPREFWQKPIDFHLKTNIKATLRIGEEDIPIYLGFTSPIPMNKIFDASFGKKIMSIRFDILDTEIRKGKAFDIKITLRNNTTDNRNTSLFFPLPKFEDPIEEFINTCGTIISLESKISLDLIKVNTSKSVIIQAISLNSGLQFMETMSVYNEETNEHHIIHRPIRIYVSK